MVGAAITRFAQQFAEHLDGPIVKRGERFVEQKQAGRAQEGASQGQALAHATGVLANRYAGNAGEIDAFEPL